MTKLTREIFGINARQYTVLSGLLSTNEDVYAFLLSVVQNIGPIFPGKEKAFITEMVEHGLQSVREKREYGIRNDEVHFITACCDLGIRIYEKKLVGGLKQDVHGESGLRWEPWSQPVDDFIAKHSNFHFIQCECETISSEAAAGIFAARNLPAKVFTRLYNINKNPSTTIT